MGFFDIFKSKKDKEKLSHLRNLLAVAVADGIVQNSELGAIAAIMSREGMNPDELERCMKNPDKIDFVVPESDNDKIRYLKDMVALMMIDGVIDDNELKVCKLTAKSYGFRTEVIDAMIRDIIIEITNKQ